jgi:hypothetical protein
MSVIEIYRQLPLAAFSESHKTTCGTTPAGIKVGGCKLGEVVCGIRSLSG